MNFNFLWVNVLNKSIVKYIKLLTFSKREICLKNERAILHFWHFTTIMSTGVPAPFTSTLRLCPTFMNLHRMSLFNWHFQEQTCLGKEIAYNEFISNICVKYCSFFHVKYEVQTGNNRFIFIDNGVLKNLQQWNELLMTSAKFIDKY